MRKFQIRVFSRIGKNRIILECNMGLTWNPIKRRWQVVEWLIWVGVQNLKGKEVIHLTTQSDKWIDLEKESKYLGRIFLA